MPDVVGTIEDVVGANATHVCEELWYVSELRDHQRIDFAQGFLGAKIRSPQSYINAKFIR